MIAPPSAPFRLRGGLRLILASASPRRRRFLEEWGLSFDIRPADAEEPRPLSGEPPDAYARRMATIKARAVADSVRPASNRADETLILAADTVVALDGRIFGKPEDDDDALAMLRALSGREHAVTSGVCLMLLPADGAAARETAFSETSRVRFGDWPDAALRAYVATGEPRDKAGAYAVQGVGAFLTEEIRGSWSNVVGLPAAALAGRLLREGWMSPAGLE